MLGCTNWSSDRCIRILKSSTRLPPMGNAPSPSQVIDRSSQSQWVSLPEGSLRDRVESGPPTAKGRATGALRSLLTLSDGSLYFQRGANHALGHLNPIK